MTRIITFLLSLFVISTGFAASPAMEFYTERHRYQTEFRNTPDSINEHSYRQLIDPSNPQAGTFSQRYYIDESFADDGHSAVFFYICGEATCRKGALNGAIRFYAKQFHARLVALEHRYYGKSIPVKDFSTANLKHLSTSNGLKDLARFQRHMMQQANWQGKWVSFGGSYPGSLSAFYRMTYPKLVVGALASSAPVKAKEDYFEYDNHVTKVVSPACALAMRQAVTQVENALEYPEQLKHYKKLFMAEDVDNNIDFLYVLADMAAEAVQYGNHERFCQALETSDNPIEPYAQYARDYFNATGTTAKDLTPVGAMSIEPDDYYSTFGMRQWFYQSCTEYGYWQIAHPDRAKSTRSSLIDINYHRNLCKRLFNMNYPVDIDATNASFYNNLFNASVSNIYLTNGSNDPWSALSMTKQNGNATNPLLTYTTITGTAHCADLHSPRNDDPQSLKQTRAITITLIKQWLSE